MISPTRRFDWTAALCCLLLAWPAQAASRTTFHPSVSFNLDYTDDVDYAGPPNPDGSFDSTSDTAYRLAAILPVTNDWQTGSLAFSYSPSIQRYADEDRFDSDEHRLRLSLDNSLNRNTSLGFDAGYSLGQSQGNLSNPQNSGFTLTQRTERQAIDGSVSLSRAPGRLWDWDASVRGGSRTHERVQAGQMLDPDLENQTFYGGQFGFSRTITRKTDLGLSVDYTHIDYDVSGEEDINDVRVTLGHRLSRTDSISFDLGASDSSFEGTNPADDDDRTGVSGSFSSNHTLRSVTLATYASHRPNTGGFRGGSSDYSTIGLSVAGLGSPNWSWGADTRYSRRDPSARDLDSIDTFGVGARVERALPRGLGLTLSVRWYDQSSDNEADNAEIIQIGVGLVWYPRGRAPRG